MVTLTPPADLALQRQLLAPAEPGAAAASRAVVTALWVLGLFTASVAITLLAAVREPLPPVPGGLHENAYLLALSVAFFAGVAGVVMAAVCIGWPTIPAADGRRRATGTKLVLVYSAVVVVVVAVGGLMAVVVSLFW